MEDQKDILIKTLTDALVNQQKQSAELQKQTVELLELVKKQNATIASLEETIEYLKGKLFGKKSEKTPDPNQLSFDFFNEAEAEADPSIPEPAAEELVQFKAKKGNRRNRDAILHDLPVKNIMCTQEDHTCPECGAEMIVAGKKFIREELMVIPAKLYRVRYYAETLKCPNCVKDNDSDRFITADAPKPLLTHSLASPTTVAYIMYRKYAMHEPLYRLEKDYLQMGVTLHRGVMANWVIYCAQNYMRPIYDRLHENFVKRDVVHADEVPCQVLHEPDKAPQTKSYMWVYLTGNDGLPGIVLYDYRPGRSGKYPAEFLKGFQGFLHCDGYQGYNRLEDTERIGCLAHARRYFFEAIPVKKDPSAPKIPAEIGVEYYNKLFMTERQIKNLSPDEIKQKRLEKEKPLLDQFFAWLETLKPAAGSRLEKAVNYSKNQKQNLLGYLKDGRLEISNNAAERRCKVYVQGRKNFLFHDQVDGAEASAIIYSLVETAKMNGLNIYSYLQNVLMYMPGHVNGSEGIDDMMPWSDFMQERCPKVEAETTEALPVGMK